MSASSIPPVAAPHWTWRSGLTERATIDDLDRWMKSSGPAVDDDTVRAGISQLAEENSRLRSVLGHCPKCIAVLDQEGVLVGYNLEFRELFDEAPVLGERLDHTSTTGTRACSTK